MSLLSRNAKVVARAPGPTFFRPDLLEPSDSRARQPTGVVAGQHDQCLLDIAGGDALEVEERDQHFEAARDAVTNFCP